jgi:ATP-dependent DNA helicase RecQ
MPEWLTPPVAKSPARHAKLASPGAAPRPIAEAASRPQKTSPVSAPSVNPDLREHLREWRRSTAKQQGVPAFVVLHDTTLDEICRLQPASPAALLEVPGIGERKLEVYGRQILEALEQFRGARSKAAGK